ncbi:MAG: hypothetical protein ACTHNS_16285 [Marmoricola sp.]
MSAPEHTCGVNPACGGCHCGWCGLPCPRCGYACGACLLQLLDAPSGWDEANDPAPLAAALDALPEGTWVEVGVAGETHLIVRVPGGWHLPGDLAVASADVAEGRPERVEVLGPDDHLPPEQAVARARDALARMADPSEADAVAREMDDLAAVGWPEAAALRDRAAAWRDALDRLTPEQRGRVARDGTEGAAALRRARALGDDR